ncbi:MAG: ribonuclease H-like domain-containing protein [Treponema sp.]|nr:ribonuclease H-like domain-containing protein [Treponema sp.]
MGNLRDRLKLIQKQKHSEISPQRISNKEQKSAVFEFSGSTLKKQGWLACGYGVLKREVRLPSPFKPKEKLPSQLPVFVPDLAGRELPQVKDFVFFDLETTGLSGGGGTVAFLAAFGRVLSGYLNITQYLLLDYPGQNDFLENVLGEFKNENSVIVTYNGKCFDSQILKTMCIMNRIKPPEYYHADLLHPCRRLWKNIIQDCSQGSIETKMLGLDRSGDIPGMMAPEIWFDFLKTGKTEQLIEICDHNKIDISGLASIFAAIISIAKQPYHGKYEYDVGRLALYWRAFLRRQDLQNDDLRLMGENILHYAAQKDHSRAVYVYSFDQMKKGNYKTSLEFVKKGLQLFDEDSQWHKKLLRRKERLEKFLLNPC